MEINRVGKEDELAISLEEMLFARDCRAKKQGDILKDFDTTLICFTMNIAGPVKTDEWICDAFNAGFWELLYQFGQKRITIMYKEQHHLKTGPEGYIAVRADDVFIKKITVNIEKEHPLGRLFDIDVLNRNGVAVSRQQIGEDERKCLICENSAKLCGRSRKHNIQTIKNKTDEILRNFYEWKGRKIC